LKTLPLAPGDKHSREAFRVFLSHSQESVRAKGKSQLISISIEVGHLDPLAVLESIYEPDELHFYCERPSDAFAVAGADAVLSFVLEGDEASRFSAARNFVSDVLENTIAVGDLSLPFSGPHFFTAFSFFDKSPEGAPFSSSLLFVPRWQVARSRDTYVAVANFLLEEDSDIDLLVERVWRAHSKFSSFDYTQSVASKNGSVFAGDSKGDGFELSEIEKDEGFVKSVAQALSLIDEGVFEKIVLARAVELKSSQNLHPLRALNKLREQFSDCYAFSVGNGKGQSFIGASPERLIKVSESCLKTKAIAGSAPRGKSASEDARLANDLLHSEKDLREHKIVLGSIARRLGELGIELRQPSRPGLLQLANIQHLHTPVTGNVGEGIHILDLLEKIHPTPAVGGTPREAACEHIPSLESFDRGLYAAPIGWVDSKGEGEFVVGIRSALIDGSTAKAFAGNGIVAGSDPEKELTETNWKLKALLENLL
jgi:menaquinone-specific isochorismate synthase